MHHRLEVLNPTNWNSAALQILISQSTKGALHGRIVGGYDPKCDDDACTYPRENYYSRSPALNKARLEEFCKSMDDLMRPGRDVTWICEGLRQGNFKDICAVIDALGWHWRPLSLHFSETHFRALVKAGAPKGRVWFKGWGTCNLAETVFVCWKPPGVPKVLEKYHKFLNSGSRIADNTLTQVRPVAWQDLPRMDPEERKKMLSGTEFKPDEDDMSEDSAQDVESGSDGGKKNEKKRKYTKRGKALRRQQTNPDEVIAYYRPTSPAIVAELNHMFGATYFVSGTPEMGISLTTTMENGTPCLAMCRNLVQKTALLKFVTIADRGVG